jgi:ubiquinone/menaquinone biosynthesis C-methylase UbiE
MDKNIWDSKIEYLKMTRKHFWNDDYFEFLVKFVWKLDKPINVVDFGCGYGYLGLKLLPLLPQGSTYTGIDIGVELLKDAEKLFENIPLQANFIKANLVDYNPIKKYDLAICQAVLRHIPQYKHVLEKMVDSVIDNGKVICIEVNRRMENAGLYIDGIDFRIDEKDMLIKHKWMEELQNGGRDYLTGIKVPILMEELGLKDVSVRVNDYVEFISPKQDKDEYDKHIRSFIKEHELTDELKNEMGISALNARSLLISYGTK